MRQELRHLRYAQAQRQGHGNDQQGAAVQGNAGQNIDARSGNGAEHHHGRTAQYRLRHCLNRTGNAGEQAQQDQHAGNPHTDMTAGDTGELDEEQLESARDRFSELVDSCPSDEQLVRELNELSVELRRIIWFGPLSELATGYREFAMALRHYYWQQLGEEDEPDAAIEPEQWGELVEVLDDFLIDGDYH